MTHHSSSAIALSCAMVLATFAPAVGAAAPRQRAVAPEPAATAAFTSGRGAARLSLAEPRDVSAFAPSAKRAEDSRSLAAGDFDGDGRADLVAGYAAGQGGLVSVARGADGGAFGDRRDFELPAPADFVVAGDFDGDRRADVLAAARGGAALYLLRGDGRGGFSHAETAALPGAVTALASGERGRRGLPGAEVAVAISDGERYAALVFSAESGALGAEPARVDLPADASALAVVDADGDGYADVAAAVGDELVVATGGANGLADVVSERFERSVRSVVAGRFSGGARLAALDADGAVSYVAARRDGGAVSLSRDALAGAALPNAERLVAAHLSTGEGDDIVALGAAERGLRVVAREAGGAVDLSTTLDASASAAIAIRLNEDAFADLVTLDSRGGAPRALLTAAASTFAVTNTNDSGSGSLRQAIEDANGNLGPDLITFDIDAKGVQTIRPFSALPVITGPVTIDGYSQPGAHANTLAVGDDAAVLVEIDGEDAGDGKNGLTIASDSTVIRGLAINNWRQTNSFPSTGGTGVVFDSVQAENANDFLEGCFVGTDPAGAAARPNEVDGVRLLNVRGVTVGGASPAARNVVAGNTSDGVHLVGSSANAVLGNYVGTNAAGTALVANQTGVRVEKRSANNDVGGDDPGEGNVVNSSLNGITVSDDGTDLNEVVGNFVGTNAAGTAVVGNAANGVRFQFGASASIMIFNVVGGSGIDGLLITGEGTDQTQVLANSFGTNEPGTVDLGNGGSGVSVVLGAGETVLVVNTIAFNGGAGVRIDDAPRVAVLNDRIFENGGLGIDLNGDGVTQNDAGDADAGENGLQNFPALTSAVASVNGLVVTGSLDSAPGAQYTVEAFVSDAADPTGFGEGKTRIASTTLDGPGAFTLTPLASAPRVLPGQVITATATNNTTGQTSEFSAAIPVVAVRGGNVSGTVFVDADRDGARDAGEAAQPGVQVFADLDANGKLDAGEPSSTSGADGAYTLRLTTDGTFAIREVVPFGFAPTTPNPATVAVSFGAAVTGVDFGNRELPRVVCLVDDVTGDTFSIGVLQGDAGFAKWTYRIARTGRTITGTATSMVFIAPTSLVAVQVQGESQLMNASLDTDKAKGTAKVVDPTTGKVLTVKDTVRGGGC